MAPRMRRILIAYDGTEPSGHALELGLELARATGATVGLVSVPPPEPEVQPDSPWSEVSAHAAILHAAKLRADAAGVSAELHEPVGNPGPMIVKVAIDFDYDTIVVGARRLSGLRRTLLGSVSRYVARQAPMTTVIAR